MVKYRVGGYVRLSRDDDYSESDGYSKTNEFKKSRKQRNKKVNKI